MGMLGCIITLMESGHPGGLDMEDTVLVFVDARSVKLLQKVNPMLMLGCTTTHMVYGQHGTPDTIPMDLLFGDVRREKPKLSLKLMPKPKLTTSCTEYGQLGTLDTIVSTDGSGVTLLVNHSLSPPNHENIKIQCNLFFKIKELLNVQLAQRLKSGNLQLIRSI